MRSPRFVFGFVVSFLLLCACSGVTEEWQAASAAKDYYDCLVEGNTTGFLEGKAGIDDLPDAYAEQLLKAVEQYQADMQQKHGGLREVRIVDNHYLNDHQDMYRDTTLHYIYAYLLLCYGDSTQEEITVPMVKQDDKWHMK